MEADLDNSDIQNRLDALSYTASSITITADLIAMFLFWKLPRIRNFKVQMIMFLIFCDFATSVASFLPRDNYDMCQLQAGMLHFFNLSSFILMTLIAIVTYFMVVKHRRDIWRYKPLMIFITFATSSISTIIVDAQDDFGETSPWCWIPSNHEVVRWLSFDGPMIACFLVMFVFYAQTIATLRERLHGMNLPQNSLARKSTKRLQFELTFYLGFVTFVFIPGVLHRFCDLFEVHSDLLSCIHAFFFPLLGLVNSSLFFNKKSIQRDIRDSDVWILKKWRGSSFDFSTRDRSTSPLMNYGTTYESNPQYMEAILGDNEENIPLESVAKNGISKELRIFCATWNLANVSNFTDDVSIFLPKSTDHYDVVAVGTQELGLETPVWTEKLKSHLGQKYEVVAEDRIRNIHLIVFAESDLVVRYPRTQKCGTGLGNFYGNKGAVAVTCEINGTKLCFLSCHLAAHRAEKFRNERLEDLKIISEMEIGQPEVDFCLEFHAVFLLGDLNFRIMKATMEETMKHIEKGDFKHLIKLDELLYVQRDDNILNGFEEERITFPPTFKYKPYTNTYIKRVPAWCDRVLCRSAENVDIKFLQYSSYADPVCSDHKPVVSTIQVSRWENFPSARSSRWFLILRSMKITFLQENTPNLRPFATFHGSFLRKPHRSRTFRSHSGSYVNPKTVRVTLNDIDAPSNYLYIVVRDSDLLGDMDVLGSANLLILPCKPNQWISFSIDLILDTQKIGFLSGFVQLTPFQS